MILLIVLFDKYYDNQLRFIFGSAKQKCLHDLIQNHRRSLIEDKLFERRIVDIIDSLIINKKNNTNVSIGNDNLKANHDTGTTSTAGQIRTYKEEEYFNDIKEMKEQLVVFFTNQKINNKYELFIDNLDVISDYPIDDYKRTIIALTNAAIYINNDIKDSDNNTIFQITLMIKPNMIPIILNANDTAHKATMLDNNTININWYTNNEVRKSDLFVLIDKHIMTQQKRAYNIEYSIGKCWDYYFVSHKKNELTSFLFEYSFYKPRNLLCIIQKIQQSIKDKPFISINDIDISILSSYREYLFNELYDIISMNIKSNIKERYIECISRFIEYMEIANNQEFAFNEFVNYLDIFDNTKSIDIRFLIQFMYDNNIIYFTECYNNIIIMNKSWENDNNFRSNQRVYERMCAKNVMLCLSNPFYIKKTIKRTKKE